MKIAVCVSNVPDTATRIKIGSDGKAIDPAGVTFVINPYDEYAIEEALKTKEKLGEGEVVIVTLGGDSSKETIRKSLAMGADSAVLLKDDNHRDSIGIAKALAEEIKALALENKYQGKIISKGISDEFSPHGSRSELLELYGLDLNSIQSLIKSLL